MEWWTESEAKAFWKKSDIEGEEVAERERLAAETFAGWERRMAEDEKAAQERGSDFYAIQANEFRNDWITTRSRNYGSFEDTTKIPPMRFTDKAAPPYTAYPCDSLQVFSAKVAGIKGDLHWPLRVFGMVALRDCVDYNRNVIFHRTRDNYQTLTEKDPYLVLTGPTRAVMWLDTVAIEAMLKVKGTVESEDRDLSVLAVPIMRQETLNSYLFNRGYTSILGTLEFTLGHIVYSVEATIFVRIIDGSWTDGFHGLFAASSSTFAVSPGTFVARTPSIDHKKIVLLYSKDEKIVLTDDGNIKLSRSVASVEIEGELKVSVKAWAASGGANNDLECVLACTTNGLAATGGDHNALEGELVESGGAIEAASGGANNECVLACTTNELAASGGYHNALQGELVESGGAIEATECELTASTDDNNVMKGELAASHHAYNNVVEDESVFTPKENGRSYGTLDIGFCKMEVTVAWSLVSAHG